MPLAPIHASVQTATFPMDLVKARTLIIINSREKLWLFANVNCVVMNKQAIEWEYEGFPGSADITSTP